MSACLQKLSSVLSGQVLDVIENCCRNSYARNKQLEEKMSQLLKEWTSNEGAMTFKTTEYDYKNVTTPFDWGLRGNELNVYTAIQFNTAEFGISLDELESKCHIPRDELIAITEFFTQEGMCYTTCDRFHFKTSESN